MPRAAGDIDAAGLAAATSTSRHPFPTRQLARKLGKDRAWLWVDALVITAYACDRGLRVHRRRGFLTDGSGFLADVLEAAESGGLPFPLCGYAGHAGSVRCSGDLLRATRASLELEVHAHDDVGLATANSLAAVLGGATHVSTTVNGLGDRAGNAPLEEVDGRVGPALPLGRRVSMPGSYRISSLVGGASGRPVSAGQEHRRRSRFTHEAGIHVQGLISTGHLPGHRPVAGRPRTPHRARKALRISAACGDVYAGWTDRSPLQGERCRHPVPAGRTRYATPRQNCRPARRLSSACCVR